MPYLCGLWRFANAYYKIVNEELEENLPQLPQYISDGLDWLEEKLGGN